MTREVSLVDQHGRSIRNEGALLVDSATSGWHGFPLETRASSGTFEADHRHNLYPMVWWHQRGKVSVRQTRAGHDATVVYEAGCVSVVEPRYEIDRTVWTSEDSVVSCLEVRADDLRGLLLGEDVRLNLNSAWLNTDATLTQIMTAMRVELESGCLSGRMFAEGLSLAVLGHLQSRYGCPAARARASRRLSARDVGRIRDYIEDHIDQNLSIAELASVLHMSGGHFARLFRMTTGATPYRFAQHRRILRATRLLATQMPLAEIAQAAGFSSQAHFTYVFRQLTGSTPARVRCAG